jgi:hypothetical protein
MSTQQIDGTRQIIPGTITGGGGGSSTSTSAFASRPAAGNDGDLWLPSDGYQIERDNGSIWEPWGPLTKLTPPVDASFSWVNQGSATVTAAKDAIVLSDVMAASDNTRLRVKSAPSTPYTITMLLVGTFVPRAFVGVVAAFRDSVSGKIIRFACYGPNNTGGQIDISVDKMNSPTSFNSSYSVNVPMGAPIAWFRLKDDGTNRSCHFSRDGQNFAQLHSVGRTDFLTANQVGFGVQNFNNAGGANFTTIATLLSWKEE